MPRLAEVTDRTTLIRSMSYTPNGLFNHTAAIYQMHTGYTADKVSPSGQLEPPSPKDFPTFGSNIVHAARRKFRCCRSSCCHVRCRKAAWSARGTAGFLGRAFDPYTLFPPGDDMDMNKMDRINIDDLKLRPRRIRHFVWSVSAELRELINAGMPDIDRAVAKYDLDEYRPNPHSV